MRDPTDACSAIGAVSGGVHDAFGVSLARGGDEVLTLPDLSFGTHAGIGREVGGVGPLERRDERRFVGHIAPDNLDASLGRARCSRGVDNSSECTNAETTVEQCVRGGSSLLSGGSDHENGGRAHDV